MKVRRRRVGGRRAWDWEEGQRRCDREAVSWSRVQQVPGSERRPAWHVPRKQRRMVVQKNTGFIAASFCNLILFCDSFAPERWFAIPLFPFCVLK